MMCRFENMMCRLVNRQSAPNINTSYCFYLRILQLELQRQVLIIDKKVPL